MSDAMVTGPDGQTLGGAGGGLGGGTGQPSPGASGGEGAGGPGKGGTNRNVVVVAVVAVVALVLIIGYVAVAGGRSSSDRADVDTGGGVPLGAALNSSTTTEAVTTTTRAPSGADIQWQQLDDPDGFLKGEFPCEPVGDVSTIQHLSEISRVSLQGKAWTCRLGDSEYTAYYMKIPAGVSFDPTLATTAAADELFASVTSSEETTVAGLKGRASLLSRSSLRFRVAWGTNGRTIVGVIAGPGYDTPTWQHFLDSVQLA